MDEFITEFEVEIQKNFGIGLRPKLISSEVLRPEFVVIVNLTIERDGNLVSRRGHWLSTGIRQVNDAEPLVTKKNVVTAPLDMIGAATVRPPV